MPDALGALQRNFNFAYRSDNFITRAIVNNIMGGENFGNIPIF